MLATQRGCAFGLFQGPQRRPAADVSDWTSREAVRPGLKARPIPAEFDLLSVGAPGTGFYHELTVYEPFTVPVAVATCTRIVCSRAALSPVLAYMLDVSGPTLRAQPGLIMHALYQDEDRPTQFLSIRGYDSVEAYGSSAAQCVQPARRRVAGTRGAPDVLRGADARRRDAAADGEAAAGIRQPAPSGEPPP